MRRWVELFAGLAVICVGLLLIGCPLGPGAKITVRPGTMWTTVGDALVFSASSTDQEDVSFGWKSARPEIATVDNAGQVQGVAAGWTTITAQGANSEALGEAIVVVVPAEGFSETLPDDMTKVAPTMEREITLARCDCTIFVPGIAAKTYRWGPQRYHRLELMDAGKMGEVGKAELPFFSLLYAIPLDAQTGKPVDWQVEVTPSDIGALKDIVPYPVQPYAVDQTGVPTPMFQYDADFYRSAAAYPGIDYATEQFQIGNLHVLRVKVYPAQYYPSERALELAGRIEVDVRFGDGESLAEPCTLGDFTAMEVFAEMPLIRDLVNAEVVDALTAQDLVQALSPRDLMFVSDPEFQLLIITRSELYDEAYRLGRHRQDMGWRVKLVSLPPASFPDEESIRDYIVSQDEANFITVTPRRIEVKCLQAVLIFGDTEHIPAFAGLNVGLEDTPTDPGDSVWTVGTDLYYSTIRGADYYPDVVLGRISVDDVLQAAPVVDKIIHYDTLDPAIWPNHAAVYGEFQDDPTAQADLTGTSRFNRDDNDVDGTDSLYVDEVRRGQFVRPDDEDRDDDWQLVSRVNNHFDLRLDANWDDWTHSGPAELGFRDGQADRPFIDTTERVRQFLLGEGVD
ncbi:MAG: hypothetical protein GY851_16170, partial [bacterium]|nr:hypothetical protein [bacterium]